VQAQNKQSILFPHDHGITNTSICFLVAQYSTNFVDFVSVSYAGLA